MNVRSVVKVKQLQHGDVVKGNQVTNIGVFSSQKELFLQVYLFEITQS